MTVRLLAFAALLFALAPSLCAQDTAVRIHAPPLLAPQYPIDSLAHLILPRAAWRPYPTASAPEGLDVVPETVRRAYIDAAAATFEAAWPPLPATLLLDYVRTGNRSRYQNVSFGRRERLANLVLAELFEREGRFLDAITDGVWAISEETYWGVPAHLGLQAAGSGLPDVDEPTIDLFAAETAGLLAWTLYLLGDRLADVSPLLPERIHSEIDRRILTPFLERTDWGWMGYRWKNRTGYVRPVNNWNPWINSNVLTAALLVERAPERRVRLVHKVMESLDAFLEPYPADGGCDEGPSYWSRAGGSLFDTLELLHEASAGRIDVFDNPLVADIGRYIYRAHIDGRYFINFADASARISAEPALIYRYGAAVGDPAMQRFAAYLAGEQDYGADVLPGRFGMMNRVLPALFTLRALHDTPAEAPYVRDAWLPDLQVMAARSEAGRADGFYLAAKGGHNDESHNHNDVGNAIVYHDGRPVLVDAGAQVYTAQTFSNRRYALWNNQSAYHTVPTINGVMQREGRSFAGRDVRYTADEDAASLQLDLAGAYPEEAAVASWTRTVTLERGRRVVFDEDYRLDRFIAPVELNFLTPLAAAVGANGAIRLTDADGGRTFVLRYDPDRFAPRFETVALDDSRMRASWGDRLTRIVLVGTREATADRVRVSVEVE